MTPLEKYLSEVRAIGNVDIQRLIQMLRVAMEVVKEKDELFKSIDESFYADGCDEAQMGLEISLTEKLEAVLKGKGNNL